jgi:hypothetical protein
VARGSGLPHGPQAVPEENALQKLYQTRNELKIRPYVSELKMCLLIDFQQGVTTSFPNLKT